MFCSGVEGMRLHSLLPYTDLVTLPHRPHSSLGMRAPAVFAAKWAAERQTALAA